MRVLVTGAAGIVGTSLSAYLREAGHQVIPVDLLPIDGMVRADLRNELSVFQLIHEHRPELILHLASIKNLNLCENDKEASRQVNYGITEILTRACQAFNLRLLFFSSDYVFGKRDLYWEELATPCPTTQYGIDKTDSEQIIQSRLTDYAIIRTAQIYGMQGDFVHLVYKALRARQTFLAFSNLVNCPTWIGDVCSMTNKLLSHDYQGIFHCVGPESVSRYEFALRIADAFALDSSCIKPTELDFTTDVRPPIVRLNGQATYKTLQLNPGGLKKTLSFMIVQ